MKTRYILFLLSMTLAVFDGSAQNEIVEAEFYLDQDPGFGNATPIDLTSGENVSEAINASLGTLEAGTNFVYVRVKDENNMWSIPLKVPFHVQRADLPDIVGAEWYIGDDPGFGGGTSIDFEAGEEIAAAVSASTDGLSAGRNFAYLRFQNDDNTWSLPLKQPFVINDKFPLDVVAAEFFIDEDPGIGSGIPIDVDPDHFVEESYLSEVSPDLELGDHFLYTRVQNEAGDWSVNVVRTFNVGTVSTEDQALLNSTAVYPIPTRDFLTVKNDQFSILEIRLFDMNGRAVEAAQMSRDQLDLSALSSGTYLLRIATESGSITRKIVVE